MELLVNGGGLAEGDLVSDEVNRGEVVEVMNGRLQAAFFGPATLPLGIDVTDLTADKVHMAAVEVSTKIEVGAFLAIPGTNEKTAVKPRDFDGQIESLGVAG